MQELNRVLGSWRRQLTQPASERCVGQNLGKHRRGQGEISVQETRSIWKQQAVEFVAKTLVRNLVRPGPFKQTVGIARDRGRMASRRGGLGCWVRDQDGREYCGVQRNLDESARVTSDFKSRVQRSSEPG